MGVWFRVALRGLAAASASNRDRDDCARIYNNYLATVLWPHLSMPLGPSITSSPAYVVRQARSVLTDAGESLRR